MVQLHLVDGTYELFRAYFAVPSESDDNGVEVGATRGLVRSLKGLCRQADVTHVAVAFDTVVESFRNQMFDGYKTGEDVPADLMAQFPSAEQAVRDIGLVAWSMVEFEASSSTVRSASGLAATGASSTAVTLTVKTSSTVKPLDVPVTVMVAEPLCSA